MEDSRSVETEVELELYEEIVGDLDYSASVTDRPPRHISNREDRLTTAAFKGSITHSSESTVTSSASAAIAASVTWPDLRSPCSLAGKNQEPRPLAQRSLATHPLAINLRAKLGVSSFSCSRDMEGSKNSQKMLT